MYLLSLLEANEEGDGYPEETTVTGEIPRQVASVLRDEFKRFGENLSSQYDSVEREGAPTHEIGSLIEEYARIATRVDGEPDFAEALYELDDDGMT